MIDHPYERGPYGRCAAQTPTGPCNKRKAAHSAVRLPDQEPDPRGDIVLPGANSDAPPASLYRERGLPVYRHVKRRSGERGEDVRLDWPTDWPLPVAGNVIRIAGDPATVRSVVFDLDRRRIVLDSD